MESQSDTPTTTVDPATDAEPPSSFDVIVLDGMAVLHFLDQYRSSSFEELLTTFSCHTSRSFGTHNGLTWSGIVALKTV